MALRTELHVLVVDDMSVSRQILVQLLERFGVARIELAGDVDEAIAVLARRRVHVVISDLNMPGRDGIDLLRSIRLGDRTSGLRFILTSAVDASPQFAEARRLGLDALLVKPFRADRLLAALEDTAGRL